MTTRRTVSALLISGTLAACGGPTPLPTRPASETWGSVLPSEPAPVTLEASGVRYEVCHKTVGPPEREAIEALAARHGVVASFGEDGQNFVAHVLGARCLISVSGRLSEDVLPSPKVEPEYVRKGLDEAQASELFETTATWTLGCFPDGDGAAVTAAVVGAEQLADVLAIHTGGFVYQPVMQRFHAPGSTSAWRKDRRFRVERHVRIEVTGRSTEVRAVSTVGLASFGFPELAVYPIREADVARVSDRLLVVTDAVLSEPVPGEGSSLNLGPVRLALASRARYDATLSKGLPKPPGDAPTLVIVDPKARLGDVSAMDLLVHRLTAL